MQRCCEDTDTLGMRKSSVELRAGVPSALQQSFFKSGFPGGRKSWPGEESRQKHVRAKVWVYDVVESCRRLKSAGPGSIPGCKKYRVEKNLRQMVPFECPGLELVMHIPKILYIQMYTDATI